jgi:hypothetical protein
VHIRRRRPPRRLRKEAETKKIVTKNLLSGEESGIGQKSGIGQYGARYSGAPGA